MESHINKNIKRIFLVIIVLAFAMAFAGCKGDSQEAGNHAEQKEEIQEDASVRIGISFDSFVIERWIRDRDVFVSAAKELGAEVNVQNANGNTEEQIEQIHYLIDKNVNVLVIIAADCKAFSDVIARAHSKGIPVISYDRLILDAGTDLYLSFDNRQVGVLMAKALKDAIPEGGQIFMIQGSEDDNNVPLIKEGFEEEIQGSGLEVVYQANCAGWLAEQAIGYVTQALSEYPDVKGIMCGNDDIATQVIRVLSEHRLAGAVKVVGQDGDLAACQRIVEGTQTMTAFKSVEDLARLAALCAVKLGEGEDPEAVIRETGRQEKGSVNQESSGEEGVPGSQMSMNDGTTEIPCIFLAPVSVRKDNMKKIIVDGGYHSLNDVYLNVFRKTQ